MILRIRLTKKEKEDFKRFCEASGKTPREMIERTIKSYIHISKLMSREVFDFTTPKTLH